MVLYGTEAAIQYDKVRNTVASIVKSYQTTVQRYATYRMVQYVVFIWYHTRILFSP